MGTVGTGSSGWSHEEISQRKDVFLEDVKKSVESLESSVKRGIAVDHDFVTILLDDIEALKENPQLARQGAELENLCMRVLGTMDRLISYEQQVRTAEAYVAARRVSDSAPKGPKGPLIGDLKSPQTLPAEDVFLSGLAKIGTQYNMREIRGDGHCMFRSYVVGLLGNQYGQQRIKDVADSLKRLQEKSPSYLEKVQLLLASLERIHDQESLENELKNEAVSDQWVAVCRGFVREKIMEKLGSGTDEELQGLAFNMRYLMPRLRTVPDDRDAVRAYAEAMSSMRDPLQGSALELRFLDECFGTKTIELNVQEMSIEGSELPDHGHQREVFLLQRSGDHIDVAFPKMP